MLEIREAQVRGRLYEGPGFPVLEVPDEDILAYGTANHLADVATQAGLSDWVGSRLPTGARMRHNGRLGRRVRGAEWPGPRVSKQPSPVRWATGQVRMVEPSVDVLHLLGPLVGPFDGIVGRPILFVGSTL